MRQLMVDTAHQYSGLETIYLAIASVVFALVACALAVAVIRYRRRSRDQHPTGKDERNLAEGLYVAVLVVVTAFLVGATFTVEDRVDRLDEHPQLRIDVVAAQWNWKFSYPGKGVSSFGGSRGTAVLTVPVDTEVAFHATSRDVIHSFWVPERRFKRDIFPHTTTVFDLMWTKPGWYGGECAEFCGLLHGDMRFRVHALPRDEFDSWLATQRGAAR
jgi:cytochrome c oxidase subunit 2